MTLGSSSAAVAPSDGELLAQTADGARGSFDELVRRHQDAVWRLVRHLAPSDTLAEEALQEAFVAAFRGAATWSGEGSVRSWLLTLARHAAYRHTRRRAGEPRTFESLDALGASAGWGDPIDVEELVDRLRNGERVRAALAHLPPADREVLVLRDLLGHSGPEVAETLQLPLNAVKSRLHRARLRFAAAIREDSHA